MNNTMKGELLLACYESANKKWQLGLHMRAVRILDCVYCVEEAARNTSNEDDAV